MCKNHTDCGHSHHGSRCCSPAAAEGQEACCHDSPQSWDREQRIRHYRRRIKRLQDLIAEAEQGQGDAT
jgi:hypothetical protein